MNSVQEDLENTLNMLAIARDTAESLKAAKNELIENVKQSDEFMQLDNSSRFTDAQVKELEDKARTSALALYDENCELPDRVSVKWFTTVKITDEAAAVQWCKQNFTPALKLDAKMFEKAAKDGTIPAELATVSKEARAQIATKL